MKFKKQDREGIFKSLFAAYFVLLLHLALLAGVGLTVLLFKGVYHYLPWIMGGIALLIVALFWIFYLRLKRSSSDIKEVLNHPAFRDRRVEIKLLGGMASFKIDAPGHAPLLPDGHGEANAMPLLEDGERNVERRLSELAALYSRDLISDEEYDMAKKRILFESGTFTV
ncbi:MAG: SHOCT domain-containing protein [Desulfamplus sp.]|nr:SHOCT domain-containing protein [Desulfamplus sp.]